MGHVHRFYPAFARPRDRCERWFSAETHPVPIRTTRCRLQRVGRRLVVLLLAGASARAQEADFSVEAIRGRIEVLRPDLEAALGAPLGGPVDVVVTTPDALADSIANDFLAERANIEGGPRGDGLKDAAAIAGRALRHSTLGRVESERGVLEICPENFLVLTEIEPSWRGMLDRDFLDVLLLHELVHVFQERRFAGFLGAPSSLEQLQARHAVLEGHAQYVAREAAKRRGLDAAFALFEKVNTEVPPSVKDPALRRSIEDSVAQLAFVYTDGEKFFRAVTEKLGYEKALDRVFSSPPATVRAIRTPQASSMRRLSKSERQLTGVRSIARSTARIRTASIRRRRFARTATTTRTSS